ncbi:MAG: ribosomal protein S18-alanine N-acetyltransferase [Gammaproteobacteria bacterium]
MNAVVAFGPPLLRPLAAGDLDCLAEIESRAYARGWTRGIFEDCLRTGYCCRGVEYAGALAGYGIVSFGPGESHLLNLAVDPRFQRLGLGSLLLDHVLEAAGHAHCERLFLEVRPSNVAARGLYARAGFTEFSRRRDYYPDPDSGGREDALILCLRL